MIYSIRFSSASESFAMDVPTMDQRIFMVVERRVLPTDGSLLQKVIWWAPDDKPRSVPRKPFLDEVRAIVREVKRDFELLLYAYAFSASSVDAKGNRIETSGSGSLSGLRLENDPDHYYQIESGVGICDLRRWGVDVNGQGMLLETVDIRTMKKLETTNFGVATFKKRKIKSTLLDSFSALEDFLERQTDAEIHIT
jgi:hypothetical protein